MFNLKFKEFINVNQSLHEFIIKLHESMLDTNWERELKNPGRHVDPMIKKDDENRLIINASHGNSLIPLHSVQWITGKNRTASSEKTLSHFLRDQPVISSFTQSSPENLASAIIFVLLTIRSSFQQVMQDFPFLMLLLMSKFDKEIDDAGGSLKGEIESLESLLSVKSHQKLRLEKGSKKTRPGYGVGTSIFGWNRPFNKYKGISTVWKNRQIIYEKSMSFMSKKDTVGLFEYFYKTIPGLGAPKAGFVVQLVFGELGCIDMHNINLYSQFYTARNGLKKDKNKTYKPDHLNPENRMEFDPKTKAQTKYAGDPYEIPAPTEKNLSMYEKIGKMMKSNSLPSKSLGEKVVNNAYARIIKNYIDIIEGLEKDGFNTIKLWDYWVSYVAHIYGSEEWSQPYGRTGKLSGSTLDVNDPTDEKFLTTKSPIPDRNAIVTQNQKYVWIKDAKGNYKPYSKNKAEELGFNDQEEMHQLPKYKFTGIEDEKGAGGASLAHNAIWWWKSKKYWYNILKHLESFANHQFPEIPDGQKYYEKTKSFTSSSIVAKPLAYMSLDRDMQRTIFPNESERYNFLARLEDALSKIGFFHDPNWLKKTTKAIKKNS